MQLSAALLTSSTKQMGIKLIVIVMFLYWPVIKGVSIVSIPTEKSTISHLKVHPHLHKSTKILVMLFSFLSIQWSLLLTLTVRETAPKCAKFNRCHSTGFRKPGCCSENAWLKWCAGTHISFSWSSLNEWKKYWAVIVGRFHLMSLRCKVLLVCFWGLLCSYSSFTAAVGWEILNISTIFWHSEILG